MTGVIHGTKTRKQIKKDRDKKGSVATRKQLDGTTDVAAGRTAHEQEMMNNCDTIECE